MNRNLLIGLIVVVLVIGGVVLVQNSSQDQVVSTTADIQESPGDSSEVMEGESTESDTGDSMTTGEESSITLTEDGFSPREITIKAGDKVVWVNNSGARATVDSSVHPTHRDYPKLNLGIFEDGEEHSLVFDEAGTYNYHDHLNASKFGTVVVE